MKWLDVIVIQIFWVFFQNVMPVHLHLLKGFGRSRNSESDRLGFIDYLVQQLFEEITNKRSELDDPGLWPADFAHEYIEQSSMGFDYIIVGAGTAGSVVASRLSENPLARVLLIEAGGDPPILSEIHLLSMMLLNSSYSWDSYAEPASSCCKAMKDERCYWPRGRMIGGTGALNGNVFLTGYPDDYDEWEQQGNKGWSWHGVYPFYEKATIEFGTEDNPMGSLTLNYFQRWKNYDTLKDIMINGTNEVEQFSKNKSYGYKENILGTVDRGIRMNTAKTYLARVFAKRPNLYVIKNSEVTEILFRNRKAVGVEFIWSGHKLLRAKAGREVIISAGAFNTPKLLMLSGVGPSEHLKSLNIPVIKDLPAVGQNLQDHGMMPLVLKFTKNIPDYSDDITANSLYEYLMFQKGPLASSPTLIGFIKTLEDTVANNSDIMLVTHFSKPTAMSNAYTFLQFKKDLVQKFLQKVENKTTLDIVGLIFKPKSRGFIKLRSNHPLQEPLIYNSLASAEEDQQALLRFIRLVQKLQKTLTFQYYGLELVTVPLEECDLFPYDSNKYWLCYIKYFFVSSWHAAGTCRMGPASDPSTVLDERLRVHGVKGLRVIDASIMPNITSGNTNGPTVMIAEKGAKLVADDWHR